MHRTLISKIVKALNASEIPYVIVGGQASLLYGVPRVTQDVDVTLGIDIDEIDRVIKLVKESGFEFIRADAIEFAKRTRVLLLSDKESGLKVDLIFSFSSFEKNVIERANKIKLNSDEVRICTVEDLIVFKIVAGREIDLFDVRNVLLNNHGYDIHYIEKWLSEFGEFLGEDLLQRFKKIRITLE